MKIKLNHYCCTPGSVGNPGDVVEMPERLARFILANGGGVAVMDSPRAVETASVTYSENTAARVDALAGRKRGK